MEMPHSADRYSNMPLPFRRYREAAIGCRDQFVVACLGSFVFVAVVVVVVASAVSSRLIFLCAASLACSRHVTGSFASQNLTYFAPMHGSFLLNEPFPLNQATCAQQ